MKSGIYRIYCTASGKSYLGSALNLSDRFIRHRYLLSVGKHHSVRLQNAWDKHGAEAFEFRVLEYVEKAEDLTIREQVWLDREKTYTRDRGYNVHRKARSSLGVKRRPETREKMSAWQKGRTLPESTRKKLSEIAKQRKGATWTPEMRQRQAQLAREREAKKRATA